MHPLLSQPPTKRWLIFLNKSQANIDQSAVLLVLPNPQETQTKIISTACFHTWCRIISFHNITSTSEAAVTYYVAQLEILVLNYQNQLLHIWERWYLDSTCLLADFLCIKRILLGNIKNTEITGKQVFSWEHKICQCLEDLVCMFALWHFRWQNMTRKINPKKESLQDFLAT